MSVQVALTEYWAQKHEGSVGFYSMHPGWVNTDGVKKSMPGFYSTYVDSYSLPGDLQTTMHFDFNDEWGCLLLLAQ